MVLPQPRTIVIHAHGLVAHKSTNVIVQLLSAKLDFKRVQSIQFIPGGRIRVTFSSSDYRDEILSAGKIDIDGVHVLDVTESDSPLTSVYVHYLPLEAGDEAIHLALRPFGKVIDISHQRFSGFRAIKTGTRIVRMSLDHHIPFECTIRGFPCRVWYRGQPIKCVICKGAHKAAECPDKNNCRRCHQPGHVAKDCQNAWGVAAPANPPAPPPNAPRPPAVSAGGVASSGPPAAQPRPLMANDVPAPPSSQVDPSQTQVLFSSQSSQGSASGSSDSSQSSVESSDGAFLVLRITK